MRPSKSNGMDRTTGWLVVVLMASLLFLLSTGQHHMVDGALGVSQHCTWHGTAPVCWPSCPMGKVSKMESKCGKNKLLCCITGTKKLCCPRGLDITPEMAAAIAQ